MTGIPLPAGERLVLAVEVAGDHPGQELELLAPMIRRGDYATQSQLPTEDISVPGMLIHGFTLTERTGIIAMRAALRDNRPAEILLLPPKKIDFTAIIAPSEDTESDAVVQLQLGLGCSFVRRKAGEESTRVDTVEVTFPREDPIIRARFYSRGFSVLAIYYE